MVTVGLERQGSLKLQLSTYLDGLELRVIVVRLEVLQQQRWDVPSTRC